jgi:hypothetical protein
MLRTFAAVMPERMRLVDHLHLAAAMALDNT